MGELKPGVDLTQKRLADAENLRLARLNLEMTGFSDDQVDAVARAQQALTSLPIFAPISVVIVGKVGRADTATDPAPPSMAETIILLKPSNKWPRQSTWYDSGPSWARPLLRHITPDHASTDDLVRRMNAALEVPGVSNAWTMPIRNRIEMQNTGIRTAIGIKISGPNPKVIQDLGEQIEHTLRRLPETRSAFAERTGSGYFLDIDLKRAELARYGLTVADVEPIVYSAIGGDEVSTVLSDSQR